ncbi:hypothetical protein ES707_20349 [subsurface metagenome]
MGYYARKWLYNCWCLVCLFVFISITSVLGFNSFGITIAAIFSLALFFIEVIFALIKRGTKSSGIKEPEQRMCPRCLVLVDKETGICPDCGGKV